MTGPEAFESGLVTVTEHAIPQVASLVITNTARVPLLMIEGESLIGGRQNRTLNVTVLCPPHTATAVPVSCVEAHRWHDPQRAHGMHQECLAAGIGSGERDGGSISRRKGGAPSRNF